MADASSPFHAPVNQLEDSLLPATPRVDILGALQEAIWTADDERFLAEQPPAMVSTELLPAPAPAGEVPDFEAMLDGAPIPAPPTGDAEAVELVDDLGALVAPDFPLAEISGNAPDMSGALPAVQELQNAMNPVSFDELRQMVTAGMLGGKTDPYGDRLRHTIRRLVRGL